MQDKSCLAKAVCSEYFRRWGLFRVLWLNPKPTTKAEAVTQQGHVMLWSTGGFLQTSFRPQKYYDFCSGRALAYQRERQDREKNVVIDKGKGFG